MSKLTAKQRRFVEQYLIDGNATAAYQRAGYKARGNSASASASALLRNPNVAAAVAAGQVARSERTQITQDDVLKGLHAEARRDGEGSSHGARVSAWGLIGKHLGMFKDRVEVTGKDGGQIQIIHTIKVARPAPAAPDPPQ